LKKDKKVVNFRIFLQWCIISISDRLLDQAMQLPNTEATIELLLESAQKVWEGPDIDILDHLSDSVLQRLADALKYKGWHN
jgi:hypothetical protein